MAIQSARHTDEAVFAALAGLLTQGQGRGKVASGGNGDGERERRGGEGNAKGVGCGKVAGIGANDAAKGIGVPLTLAKEYLLLAENSGVLCRDQGPEGLVFYENFFARL